MKLLAGILFLLLILSSRGSTMQDSVQLKVKYTEFVDIPANLLLNHEKLVYRMVEDSTTGNAAGIVIWRFQTDNPNLEIWVHKPLNSVNPVISYGPFDKSEYLFQLGEGISDVMFYFYDRALNNYGVIFASIQVYNPLP